MEVPLRVLRHFGDAPRMARDPSLRSGQALVGHHKNREGYRLPGPGGILRCAHDFQPSTKVRTTQGLAIWEA